MSETGESDDGYEKLNCRRGRKRKIIMRIEFNDTDEASTDSDVSGTSFIRASNLSKKRSKEKRALISSDETSSNDDEVTNVKSGCSKDLAVKTNEEIEGKKSLDGFASDSSSDDTLEKCPICFMTFRNQEVASPSSCEHIFCFLCLEEWAKNVTTCPIDRREFKSILVRDSFLNKNVIREVNTECQQVHLQQDNDDVTNCEICHQHDREDVMLLCDGCNQGYHMDCLTPPLSEIPSGSWYCDHCFESEEDDLADDLNLMYEDLRELGVPETRLRIRAVRQPRVPRTRQLERVRARVVARTTNALPSQDNRSQHVAGTSSRAISRKRSRKRRATRRRRTYVVEYDINNYDEKFAIKSTKRYIRKRKNKRRRTKRKGRNVRKNNSCQLQEPATSAIESRSLFSAPSFSIFGNPNDLEYFSDSEDGLVSESMVGGTSVQAPIRIRNSTLERRKGILTRVNNPPLRVDILSDIMELQDRWHNVSRQNQLSSIRIGVDGSLSFQNNFNKDNSTEKKDVKNKGPCIDQAPLYPRGSNPNFSGGERYDNSNNYRNNSGFRNTGNQYRHSTGSSGFNSFRSNDNIGQYNRNTHQGFSNNIQITPIFSERIRNLQNQRPDRRNTNRFENENPIREQNIDQSQTTTIDKPAPEEAGVDNNSSTNVSNIASISGNSTASTANLSLDLKSSEITSNLPSVVPPLSPPPWNKNLFRLTGDYDDDDDADCPNFSIYSAESLQVARSSKDADSEKNCAEQGQVG